MSYEVNTYTIMDTTQHVYSVLSGHRESVLSVCWSPRSDNLLASGGCDHCILLWDVRKARSCVASLDQHNGKKASNVPHLGCLSICLYMYSFLSDCLLKLVCLTACLSVQMPVILSKYLSTGLSILSCLPCCLLLGVAAHNGIVTSLSFLVDGLHLLSFGRDNRLRLWDVLTSRNTLLYEHSGELWPSSQSLSYWVSVCPIPLPHPWLCFHSICQ
jgi:WD40 repeat protein